MDNGEHEKSCAPSSSRPLAGYLRPTLQKAARRMAPAHNKERFEAETLGGRLWIPDCQATASKGELVDRIPLEFSSIDEYIATFDPLVLEEAREGLKAAWAENCSGGTMWRAEIVNVEPLNNGWASVQVRVQGRGGEARAACGKDKSIVVLTLGKPPQRGAIEWAAALVKKAKDEEKPEEHVPAKKARIVGAEMSSVPLAVRVPPEGQIVAGIAIKSRESDLVFKIHAGCAAHEALDGAPCASALAALKLCRRGWWITPAGMLTTSEREYDALHAVRTVDHNLMRHILKPRLLADIGRPYENEDVRRRLWPHQANKPGFVDHLKRTYDYKQLEAIEMAAGHLGTGSSDAAAPMTGHSKPTALPFVLIQGPPGTGKTHTVRGVLNVWHLVAFQRYYDSLIAKLLPEAPPPAHAHAESNPIAAAAKEKKVLDFCGRPVAVDGRRGGAKERSGVAAVLSKPRILICTPSNAACDELMSRVMTYGFCDAEGRTYYPNIVRVGAANEAVLSPVIKGRSLKALVSRYLNMSQADWQRLSQDIGMQLNAIQQEVLVLEVALKKCIPGSREAFDTARRLLAQQEKAQKLTFEIERLEAARDIVWAPGGGRDGRTGWRRNEVELEAAILLEAEMVFATLSSTRREAFRKVAQRAPFTTVLIDEAGQASEVAALQPLAFGARQVVLVGDPQQLPATILSEAAKALEMERSLFERLQAQGCPVVVLTVQYRMHPEIRSFPSRHFYHNALEDAVSVTALPPEPFHSHRLMGPYLMFDVSKGKEQRRKGGSLSNVAEAEMAAGLYVTLREFLVRLNAPMPSIAVVTPYREQKNLLRDTFESVCGQGILNQVAVETIDSYQGRQVDVVILSCVRASGGSAGLGFVNDIRRMNVAITRARRSLWILGAVETLRNNKEWATLLDDARERGLVVEDADAETLFPDVEYWQGKGYHPSRNDTVGNAAEQKGTNDSALLQQEIRVPRKGFKSEGRVAAAGDASGKTEPDNGKKHRPRTTEAKSAPSMIAVGSLKQASITKPTQPRGRDTRGRRPHNAVGMSRPGRRERSESPADAVDPEIRKESNSRYPPIPSRR